MEIDTVLFDLAGVVCHFRPERRLHALAAKCGRTAAEVERTLYGGGIIDMADDGRLDRAGLENRLRAELNLTVPRNELERLWVSAFDPDTAVLALVHRLRPVAALGLLTNNDALLSEALPIYLPETTEPFDALLFSGVLKVRKPAVTAYRKALAILGREPARTLFIDDSAQNVEGAQDAGLTAIRFTGADDLAAELRRLGLLTA